MPPQNAKNVILGIGNKALSDDAVGIKVVGYIMKNYPDLAALQVIDGGNLSYELTTVLESAENIIVINAATFGLPPGTMTTLLGTDMDQIFKRPQRNANETALADMFEIARLANKLPSHRAFISIEPKKISWGSRLSACVSKAIPKMAQNALTLMSQWTGSAYQTPAPPSQEHVPPANTQPTKP